MRIQCQCEDQGDGRVLLRVAGEVSVHTASRLVAQLKPLLTDANREVRVSLEGVDTMDSAGVATLVEGLKWSRATGGRFVLCGVNHNVRDALSLARLDDVFEIEEVCA